MDETQAPKRKCLSNAQFFTVCNELLNRREEVTSTCHTIVAVAEYLSERTKLNVTESAASAALKATGIEIVRSQKKQSLKALNYVRTIGHAVLKLYEKLGEKPAQGFVDAMKILSGKDLCIAGEPDQPDQHANGKPQEFAVPVKSIPKPHTINVVNGSGK